MRYPTSWFAGSRQRCLPSMVVNKIATFRHARSANVTATSTKPADATDGSSTSSNADPPVRPNWRGQTEVAKRVSSSLVEWIRRSPRVTHLAQQDGTDERQERRQPKRRETTQRLVAVHSKAKWHVATMCWRSCHRNCRGTTEQIRNARAQRLSTDSVQNAGWPIS
jgi:hypothetical protein